MLQIESYFSDRLLCWFDRCGRKNLPWQKRPTPYRIWVSEMMLQQTQVCTVIPYFKKFIKHFPTITSLANASIDDVLFLWSGLGYYRRAHQLHHTAQCIVSVHHGRFPRRIADLIALPGIGRSTAGAIAAIAWNMRAPILDGNVKRVLTRYWGIGGWPGKSAVEKALYQKAEMLLPYTRVKDYTQAMMDLGALVCTRKTPLCQQCPLQLKCIAHATKQQTRYPTPKPKKVLPVKTVGMLILTDAMCRVLLKRRTSQKIWSGLWSFPEFAITQRPIDALSALDITMVGTLNVDPIVPHKFSHYCLEIHPVRAVVEPIKPCKLEGDWMWCDQASLGKMGVPAPVKKLLDHL